AALLAVDNGNRATPITLTRNTPIAEPIIHLTLRHRTVATRFLFQPFGNFLFRVVDSHAVKKARIDHAAVAIIGHVGNDESLWILSGWAHNRRIAETIFVDEVEVALVVRRTAEDGAGAVVHQNEIRDIHR